MEIAVTGTSTETCLWSIERELMKRYGVDQARRLADPLYCHHYSRLADFVLVRWHPPYPLDWRHFGRHRVHGLFIRHHLDSDSHELR